MKEYEDEKMLNDYDPDNDSLFLSVPEREDSDYAYSKTYHNIIVDFDKDGKFLGIEIMHIKRMME